MEKKIMNLISMYIFIIRVIDIVNIGLNEKFNLRY